MKVILKKPDIFGALASTLCVIHCLLTPVIFFTHSCSIIDGCSSSPSWWKNLDYIFLIISFIAIRNTTKTSTNNAVKYILWILWGLLSLLTINEKFSIFKIEEYMIYIVASTLAVVHIYNLKYCKCKSNNCCTNIDE